MVKHVIQSIASVLIQLPSLVWYLWWDSTTKLWDVTTKRICTTIHAFTVIAHLTMTELNFFDPLSLFDTDSSFLGLQQFSNWTYLQQQGVIYG